jgi:NCS1 family nucleobase:cation symporter-1
LSLIGGLQENKLTTVQFPLVMIHPRKMRWLFFIKSMAAIIAAFALLGWSVKTAGGGGPVLAGKTKLSGAALSWAWVGGINIAIAGKTTLALNMVCPSFFH